MDHLRQARIESDIESIKRTWENPGINPEYHQRQKDYLREKWFLLYINIEALLKDY